MRQTGVTESPAMAHVLVVDDEMKMLKFLVEALPEFGYETTGCATAGETLEALKLQDFDLLLTDLKLPDTDGIELLRAALRTDPNLVVIVMTGYASLETAVEAMRAGAFDYIAKPFRMDLLLPALSRALEVRRLRLENVQLQEAMTIYDLARALSFPLNDSAILDKAVEAALQQSRADEVSIMLPTRDGQALYVAAVKGDHLERFLGAQAPIDEGVAGWVARNHQAVILYGTGGDSSLWAVSRRKNVCAALSMPMLAAGNFVGVINANIIRKHGHFTPGQLKTMSILVGILAPLLQSSRLFREVSEAEEKYRSIFENALEGIFQTTPDGRYLSANPALARMYGYDSPEELMKVVTDLQAQQYVNPEDRDRLKALYEKQGFVEGFETEVHKRDGDRVWISMNARAAKTQRGQTLYYEGTTEDITSRKEAEAELHAARERLRSLSRSLLQKMEAERYLIARELHDEIGQALTAVKLNLQSLKHQSRDRALVSAFPESISIIDKALEQVRSLSLNLRPSILDDLGLVAALRWLVDHMGRSAKLQIELTYDTLPRLPIEIETACFRIAQESITNVIRHAKAKNIVVGLHADDEALHLSVRDNGIGFDTTWAQTQAVHGGSVGLLGMQERAALVEGSISIDSTPGEGTEIKAHFALRRE